VPDVRRFPQDYKKQGDIWILKEVNAMPSKQEAIELQVVSDELRSLTERLEVTRKSIKLMEDQETTIKDRLKEVLSDWDVKKLTEFMLLPETTQYTDEAQVAVPITEPQLVVLTVRPSSSKSLSKDKLIDNGVLPSVIEKSYKESKFVKYEPKCGF